MSSWQAEGYCQLSYQEENIGETLTGTDDVALAVKLASTAKLVTAVVGTVAGIDSIRSYQGGPGRDVVAGRVDSITNRG